MLNVPHSGYTDYLSDVTAHIDDETSHTEDETVHTEVVIAYIAPATANKVLQQSTWMLQQPT